MKLDTFANIINNLWQDEDVNGIVVRLKWQDITCSMVLDCRNMATCDFDQVEFAINDTITKILKNITTEAQHRFTSGYIVGPGIKYVRISKTYLDPKIMECRATLEGGFEEEAEYKIEPAQVVRPGDILDPILQNRDYCCSCANSYTEKGVEGIYCKFTDEFVIGKTAQIMGCDKYYKPSRETYYNEMEETENDKT